MSLLIYFEQEDGEELVDMNLSFSENVVRAVNYFGWLSRFVLVQHCGVMQQYVFGYYIGMGFRPRRAHVQEGMWYAWHARNALGGDLQYAEAYWRLLMIKGIVDVCDFVRGCGFDL